MQNSPIDELDQSDLEKRLRELNFGYRARYIYEAVHFLKYTVDGMVFFEQLKSLSTNDARRQLSQIMGVGRKVKNLGEQLIPFASNIFRLLIVSFSCHLVDMMLFQWIHICIQSR